VIANSGSDVLFVAVESSGYPVKPPVVKSELLDVQREWFNADGSAWRGGDLKVGDMLIVRLTARARARVEDGLVVDRVPAGVEIENVNLSQGPAEGLFSVGGVNIAQAMSDARIKHREFRDDRFVAAVRLEPNPVTLFYRVRVVSPGKFVVPGVFAEDMYRPELRTVGAAGKDITIVDPRAPARPAASASAPATAASK
jgi:alpha-2-macroglobulin